VNPTNYQSFVSGIEYPTNYPWFMSALVNPTNYQGLVSGIEYPTNYICRIH
jgi:hypothetical protein